MLTQFTPAHLALINLQKGQSFEMVTEQEAEMASQMGPAWTLTRPDGHVIGCGGFVITAPEQAIGWAYIAQDAGKKMLCLVRMMRAMIEDPPWGRVDFLVHDEFPQAHRMAKMLGAERTGGVTINSRDGTIRHYSVYSRGSGHGWH
jgi:hypothetical protein